MREKIQAEAISIKSPCSENWDEMSGNEKTRACSHCSENVNDISMMTETKAWDLIDESNGNLCVRYESHPVTNAPIFRDTLYQITRQTGVTAGVLGATLAVSTLANGQEPAKHNNSNKPPVTISIAKDQIGKSTARTPKVSPTPPIKQLPVKLMGKIAIRRWIKNPLMKAVKQGKNLKARLMIDKGVDVNETDRNYYSRTALHIAVEENNLKIAQSLLNAGADLEARDQYKNTPLMNLRWSTSAEMIQILVQHGAKLNAANHSGQTALMDAARSGNLNVVKALLESGADARIRDNYKNSALDITSSEEIKQLLITYGAEKKSQ